jgi:hypothetical protein
MSLYYATIEKLDKSEMVLNIRIMDTANIKQIPATKSFFMGTVSFLINRLSLGFKHYIILPKDVKEYQEKLNVHSSVNFWKEFNRLYFGEKCLVSAEEYAQAKETFSFKGHDILLMEEGETDGVMEYILKLSPQKAKSKEMAENGIKEIMEVKSKNKKQQSFIISFDEAVFPGFLEPGMAWESIAAW